MANLEFHDVHGGPYWHCGGDYKKVFLTKVSGPPGVLAYVFTANINLDFDGSPTAYGPPSKQPDDNLANAGLHAAGGYYGIMSMNPANPTDAAAIKNHKLELDLTAPKDLLGRYPVMQKTGDSKPGFYVSTSSVSTGKGTRYEQKHYVDSSAIAFGALSGGLMLRESKFALNDFGLAIRHNLTKQSGLFFGDRGNGFALGECPQKVFTNLGGTGKNNNFLISYILFPGSRSEGTSEADVAAAVRIQLGKISQTPNAGELPLLMAFYEQAHKDHSGLPLLKAYRKKTDAEKKKLPLPPNHANILAGLRAWGYWGDVYPFVSFLKDTADSAASTLASAIGRVLP